MVDHSGDADPYAPGETVINCEPFAHVVSQQLAENVCDGCMKRTEESFKRCSGCHFVRYCGATCQKNAWLLHKEECKYLKFVAPKIPTDTVRLIARILIKLKRGGGQEFGSVPDGTRRRFEDLMTHQNEIKKDEKRMEAFIAFYGVLQQCGTFFTSIPRQEVFEVYCRILINSFNIMDDEYQPIGIGLYLAASVLDHSCVPNATVVFDGKEILVRCIEEVCCFDYVRISYTNLMKATSERQKELMSQYYFKCDCGGCKPTPGSPEEMVEKIKTEGKKCMRCSAPVISDLECDGCGATMCPDLMQRFSKLNVQVREYIFENKYGHPEPLEQAEDFYCDMSLIFHPANINYLPLLEYLTQKLIRQRCWAEASACCLEALDGYKIVYPKYDVNTALMCLKYAKLASLIGDGRAAKALIDAESIIKITHGTKHPLYSETLDRLISDLKYEK